MFSLFFLLLFFFLLFFEEYIYIYIHTCICTHIHRVYIYIDTHARFFVCVAGASWSTPRWGGCTAPGTWASGAISSSQSWVASTGRRGHRSPIDGAGSGRRRSTGSMDMADVCLLVGWSVGRSVGWLVGWLSLFVGWLGDLVIGLSHLILCPLQWIALDGSCLCCSMAVDLCTPFEPLLRSKHFRCRRRRRLRGSASHQVVGRRISKTLCFPERHGV